ncbi:ribosomal protein S18-alanine N-acetyltransferase [Alphaproteobacteria bacterium KMM 3653]|uniref:[Ribosomal protein bS18]-alanine N-acetyltransferase n=1 Tax=Harenicola maris TaxID=2841044 RepID=A0AAP2G631_9RHOB|nr:ribosomal protein S18-alanine N-acetyltransferase [Harenicola maris]
MAAPPNPQDMNPEEMARIHAAAFPHAPWGAQALGDLLKDPLTAPVFAPHGFALARLVLDEAEILTIAIDPAHQGRGHGTALLRALLETLQDRGAATCFLEVSAENAPALALYAQNGFAQTGRRSGYYHTASERRIDALLLSKSL